jgi:hypothetical protein
MFAWNTISLVLIILTFYQAENSGWKRPKFVSWATLSLVWFGGTFALWLVS